MGARYSDNIDYLLSTVVYLAISPGWWARSPSNMATELNLDAERLRVVFEAFPGLFRKSHITDKETGEHYFALQARYAQRTGSALDEREKIIDVPALSAERLKLITDFIAQMAEAERVNKRLGRSGLITMVAAIIAAVAALSSAFIKTVPVPTDGAAHVSHSRSQTGNPVGSGAGRL